MGDICDYNDLERFMRSSEGKLFLKQIAERVKGRTVLSVRFTNEVQRLGVILQLDDGNEFACYTDDLDVLVIRERFNPTLERELLLDRAR